MLTILNRGYKDHLGRAIVGSMPIANAGDKGTYSIDYEVYFGASLSFNLSLSYTQGSTSLNLNGANWSDLGVTAGDSLIISGQEDVQGNAYGNETKTVNIVNGNTLILDSALTGGTRMCVVGEVKVIKSPQAVKTKFNLIPKDQLSGVNSLIDASVPTLVNDSIGGMAVSDVLPLDLIGDLSGHGIVSASIERLTDTKGGDAKSYRITVIYHWWLYLSNYSDEFFSDATDSAYIESSFLPLWNNPSVALTSGFKPENDGNSGFRDENFNQNPNNFKVNSISWNDGTDIIGGLDFAKPSYFDIEVENIIGGGFGSEIGLILFNDIEDSDIYSATSSNNNGNFSHLRHTIFTEKADITVGTSGVTYSGYIGTNGEQLDIEVSSSLSGQILTISGVVTPNIEFTQKFLDLNNTEREFVLLTRVESASFGASNYSDTVNLTTWIGEIRDYPPVLGEYFDCYELQDHANNRICGSCVPVPDMPPSGFVFTTGEGIETTDNEIFTPTN